MKELVDVIKWKISEPRVDEYLHFSSDLTNDRHTAIGRFHPKPHTIKHWANTFPLLQGTAVHEAIHEIMSDGSDWKYISEQAIYYTGNYLITKYLFASVNTPFLLNTTKNAKHALVISQDSTSINYIPIKKSEEQDGIQFTYGFWFLLDNVDYKKGEWKHVFHKGNSSSYPNRAPGVWFHPDKNSIRVYMNTMENILEYADIDNLPLRKWVYMNIILNNRNLDLYINGYLKIRKELSSIPKQNNDDFWINMYGGFEGYLSNIRYYSYAINFNDIYKTIKDGPSTNNCIDTGELPPYLDDNWWFSYNG